MHSLFLLSFDCFDLIEFSNPKLNLEDTPSPKKSIFTLAFDDFSSHLDGNFKKKYGWKSTTLQYTDLSSSVLPKTWIIYLGRSGT